MRAALYIRVSTEEQANEGFSIGSQRDRLTAYVHSQEWDIYDYYVDDGYSAKNTNRPALQRMINDGKEKKFDVVLCHKLDRFTRSVKDLYVMLDDFEKHKIGFRSAQEQFDTTTPMGRAMMGMLGIFAQWERETIAERVFWGQEQMTLEGRRPGAPAPLGYDLVDGKLIINPEKAELVRRLFKLYTGRNGMPSIIRILANEGNPMNIKTLHYILTNPVYCGKVRWNFRSDGNRTGKEIIVDGDHEPIITVEDFEKVQELRVERGRIGRAATSNYPFSEIAKCGRCGSPLVGASRERRGNRERFYRCSGNINYGICDMPNIREYKINDEFIRKLNANKKELSKLIVVPKPPKEKDLAAEIEQELEQISKRKKRWQLAFANGLIEIEELRQHIEPDKERENELRSKLSDLPKFRTPTFTKEDFIEQLSQLREIWPKIDDDMAKKEFISELFESITINTSAQPGYRKFDVEITDWTLK